MIRVLGLILLAFSAGPITASHQLILADFTNASEDTSFDTLVPLLKETLALRLSPHGVQTIDGLDDTSANPSASAGRSRFKFVVEGSRDSIVFSFFLETGVDRKQHRKRFPYSRIQSLKENLSTLALKILPILEEDLFARIQITTDPDSASIFINSEFRGLSPWESFLPTGNHLLRLHKGSFAAVSETLNIAPGANRFSYRFQKEKIGQSRYTPIISPIAKSNARKKLLLIVSGAVLSATIAAHIVYTSQDSRYENLISKDQEEFDRFHDSAQLSLNIRNFSAFIFFMSSAVTGYYFATH